MKDILETIKRGALEVARHPVTTGTALALVLSACGPVEKVVDPRLGPQRETGRRIVKIVPGRDFQRPSYDPLSPYNELNNPYRQRGHWVDDYERGDMYGHPASYFRFSGRDPNDRRRFEGASEVSYGIGIFGTCKTYSYKEGTKITECDDYDGRSHNTPVGFFLEELFGVQHSKRNGQKVQGPVVPKSDRNFFDLPSQGPTGAGN